MHTSIIYDNRRYNHRYIIFVYLSEDYSLSKNEKKEKKIGAENCRRSYSRYQLVKPSPNGRFVLSHRLERLHGQIVDHSHESLMIYTYRNELHVSDDPDQYHVQYLGEFVRVVDVKYELHKLGHGEHDDQDAKYYRVDVI